MYKLVIFDLDGTLLNTIGDLSAAGNYALQKMGLPQHTLEEFKILVGNGIPRLVQRMLPPKHSRAIEDDAMEYFWEYYSKHKTDTTMPYEGIKELIDRLNAAGIICTCNTNKSHAFSGQLLKEMFGESLRDYIGLGIGYPAKPAPNGAEELCRRFEIDKKDAIYVGDSDVDMITAHNAGIDACAVLWGFREHEVLSAENPTYFAKDVSELEKIILGK